MNSKQKGKRGELELANKLKEYGYDCRRGQQYNGADGSADVVGLPGIHIECKRVEKLNIYDAIAQAARDSGKNDLPYDYDLPTVFHRKDRYEWLVTMALDDWIDMYREWNNRYDKIGSPIRYLSGECETVKILGYEVRENATYLIVENGKLESRINVLHEGRVFEYIG